MRGVCVGVCVGVGGVGAHMRVENKELDKMCVTFTQPFTPLTSHLRH